MSAPSIQDAFRLLQSGEAARALGVAQALAASEPRNARAHLAAGLALRALGRYEAAHEALQRAARLAPSDHAPPYEIGVLLEAAGRGEEALAHYERSAALRPEFAPAHFAAGMRRYAKRDWSGAAERFRQVLRLEPGQPEALVNLGQSLAELGREDEALAALEQAGAAAPGSASARHALGWLAARRGRKAEAAARFEEALALDPRHFDARVALGRMRVAEGDHARAADLFTAAFALAPQHPDVPMYAAQSLLLAGRWREAWEPYYARRDSRLAYEASAAAAGRPYRVPRLAELAGREVALVGEQGLGDILFFLRFAPRLEPAVRRLAFAGSPRLHSILARTGIFDAFAEVPGGDEVPVLVADLPVVLDAGEDVFAPSLRAAPDPRRIQTIRARLEAAGPRPWIATTWRSGTPREQSAQALSKTIPIETLFGALARLPGTVLAFQRGLKPGELAAASAALGRPVRDFSDVSEDLEDALAVVAGVDRHVAVSSTNMHLAALAGATADVLVPFPPEWRSRPEGDSPWFPGFRFLRQAPDGDWQAALAALRP